MRANAVPLLDIFEMSVCLEIPFFQRQYVWNRDSHWEPLWEDLERTFRGALEPDGHPDRHFLGAIVLDQKQTPATHVVRRQVIDGQQRLITMQLFLLALRDFARSRKCTETESRCRRWTTNDVGALRSGGGAAKVLPTRHDRNVFDQVIAAAAREDLESIHPVRFRPRARKPEPRERIVEAYCYFHERLSEFFDAVASDGSVGIDVALDRCVVALRHSIMVVEIDLEQGDDAQVIFETLNARGEPLNPTDLLRNYVFLRAARNGEPQERLYETYWLPFDDEFWRVEENQGRLLRPRSDLFLQHFLASRSRREVSARQLFKQYCDFVERGAAAPFDTVESELAAIAGSGRSFRRMLAPQEEDAIAPLIECLNAFEIRTAYPFVLAQLDAGLAEEAWGRLTPVLESWIVRRAVCGRTTKDYNRIFMRLLNQTSGDSSDLVARVVDDLSQLSGESHGWPSDEEFAAAWTDLQAYKAISASKLQFILLRLNDDHFDGRMERLARGSHLSVEHLLPQAWRENWLLPCGESGMSLDELERSALGTTRCDETRRRDRILHNFGNLTLLSQPLNASVSNSSWAMKRAAIERSSLLPINASLRGMAEWGERQLEQRANALLQRAVRLWPSAQSLRNAGTRRCITSPSRAPVAT